MSHKDCSEQFGKIVRKMRLAKGLTQERLAYDADLTIYTLSQVELGKTNPTLATICQLAKGLKVSISELTKNL